MTPAAKFDVLTPDQRTRCMSSIRHKDTSPELILRSLLHRAGLRYRLHYKSLPGKPDIVFPKNQAVIFVHGCYWHFHGCYKSSIPKTRSQFWQNKLMENKRRDKLVMDELLQKDWRVMFVWECALVGKCKLSSEEIVSSVRSWLTSSKLFFELSSLS